MRVSIIGAGYVGLVSGVCLADQGHDVIIVDRDSSKISEISQGVVPFFEKDLAALLKSNLDHRLTVTTELADAIANSDITLIAVGTPSNQGQIDLKFIEEVATEIGTALVHKDSYHVIIVKSTVVPGTTESVVKRCLEESSGLKAGENFGLGMNPEFLTEGVAVYDFQNPDRIVIGGIDAQTLDAMAKLYESYADVPLLRTNPRTAEMIKYASNSMLATLISFSNELANLGSAIGDIDSEVVAKGMGLSQYLSVKTEEGLVHQAPIANFLHAGCGFGGSCLPKDIKALISHGEKFGTPMRVLSAANEANLQQPEQFARLVERQMQKIDGSRIGILGLAFKEGTDDIRESPAHTIMQLLQKRDYKIGVYDPQAMQNAKAHWQDLSFETFSSMKSLIANSDAIAIITRWPEFTELPSILKELDVELPVIDGRRLLAPTSVTHYSGIGYEF